MAELIHTQEILIGKCKGRSHLRDLGMNESIISNRVLRDTTCKSDTELDVTRQGVHRRTYVPTAMNIR